MFVSGARRRTILHADLDSFYASVEQRDDPSLRGRPVIVGGGVVLAASYEAKAYGVRTAMGGRQARAAVPARRSSCRHGCRRIPQASDAVFDVFRDTTPLVEPLSRRRGVPRRGRAAPGRRAPRSRSRRGCASGSATDVGLPITVGIARTKFLAKVASQEAKPDGLLLVPPDRELAFLHPLPVRRLWGVGAKTAEKLHAHGIDDGRRRRRAQRGDARRRWSAGRWADSCSRCPATSTAGVSSRACGGARSARSVRSDGRVTRCRPRRSTPSWST